ncbi:MAG: sugar phosphate isomerase/epimerase [Erysipelotrichales bacterium]|nr:sugar phosphate isomerase/epimerase [Erysipelotrichales bacterium]
MRKAVQQMMLGSVLKSEDSAKQILKEIKEAGYDSVELNRYMIHPTPLMVRMLTKAAGMPSGNGGKYDWPALVKEAGLEVLSLHTDLGSLEKNFEEVVKDAKSFGTKYVVVTGMYRFDYQKEEAVRGLAKRLNECGEKLKAEGLNLLYHNHNIELVKVNAETSAYSLLIRETNPEYVNFELDTYWMTEGGADAKQIMRKLGKRMKLWHVTDRGFRLEKTSMTPIVKTDSVELGTGSMDLAGMAEIAEENGVEGAVLETHRNWIHNDPIESIKVSAEYMKRL